MAEVATFELGDFALQRGRILPSAQLVYATYGTLAADGSNVVLYPTSYGAQHTDIDWLIGKGRVLDPERYFIIIPNMFTNGLSTSPSNCAGPVNGPGWPDVTHVDNVTAQRRLLREVFGVERLALIYGWSMGAQQALHWGALFPDEVERICALCGTAKTTPHNLAFIGGVKAAMIGDPRWRGTHLTDILSAAAGYGARLCKLGNVAGLYREEGYRAFGSPSMEDYIVRFWEGNFLRRDGNDSWPSSALGNSRTSVITIHLKVTWMQRSQPSLQKRF